MQIHIIISLIILVISYLSFRNYVIDLYEQGKLTKQKHYDYIVWAMVILVVLFLGLFYLLIEILGYK